MTSTTGRVLAAVLACLALALVVIGSAVRGPLPTTETDAGGMPVPPAEVTGDGIYEEPEFGFFGPLAEQGGTDWSRLDLGWLSVLLGVVALAVIVRLVVLLSRRYGRIETVPITETETAEISNTDAERRVPALLRGIEAAQASLVEHADPTDAVVAAWLQLEAAAAASGLIRSPAETPAEFTVTVLSATHADPRATRDLLELYHRARFSRHPVGASDVALAGECLGRIAASWPAPVTVDSA